MDKEKQTWYKTVWIRESNLIEDVDDPEEDIRSLRAWKWLQKQEWCWWTILELHRRIMLKQNLYIAGRLRKCDVRVGNYVAPSWKEVGLLLKNWISRSRHEKRPSYIKELHVDFESIHPFEDGNGRTGRMLMNWQRVRAGLEPLLIKADKRQDYYEWFRK